MKTQLQRILQWLVTATISLLGFSACTATSKATKIDAVTPEADETEQPLEEIKVMYGSPTWSYQADGRVMDEE